MSTITSTDLTNIVLLFAEFTGVKNILNLSNNAAHEFTPPSKDAPNAAWLGGLSKRPQGPILSLEFGKHMYSPDGWVLGSAPDNDAADIQVAEDNTKGVSKRHCRIDIHPLSCKPRINVLSRSLHYVGDGDNDLLTQHEDREITESAVLDFGGTGILAWRPKLTPGEVRIYRKKALKFSEDAALAMPRYFPPLNSAPETITSNVRYGANEKVYVFQAHSGKGASASVMVVQERMSGEIFAAKEPYFKSSDDPGIRRNRWEELNKESEYLSRLDHPHIVKVHGIVLSHDDKLPPWMIEEYIPDCLCPKSLDEHSSIIFATQMFSAVAYIHSVDIVHRDLKPDNILMKNGKAKVGDFGTARHRVQGNMDTFTGTPIYLAPEFLDEPRNYTNKVDVFSCGIMLLECLSNWDPRSNLGWPAKTLSHSTHARWMRDVIIPHIADVPEYLRPLLRGLLRRQPEKRWSALKCLVWLGTEIEVGVKQTFEPNPHASPGGETVIDRETVRFKGANATAPEERLNKRKRSVSAALSDKGVGLGLRPRKEFENRRLLTFGEGLPQSSILPWPPSQSPVSRGPPNDGFSTLPSGAAFDTPPPPSQSPVLESSASDIPSTLLPGATFVTQPPLSPEFGTIASRDQVLVFRSPTVNQYHGASFAGPPLSSPSWAPTPDRDEGEFPISGKDDEYSLEESDTELLRDWNDREGDDED